MAQEDDDAPLVDWKARLDRVRKENQDLYLFVDEGERAGWISKEAVRACFAAGILVIRRSGILTPRSDDEPPPADAVLCTVGTQSNHKLRLARLQAHPELESELNRRIPSVGNRRDQSTNSP